MDILSYKLGKNASGGGGGGSTEWVYPFDKTPDQIASELFGSTTLYALKFLILSADDEVSDILCYYKNVSSNTETYFSDGNHLTGTSSAYNYAWDKTKDIETPYGKKRWILQVAKTDTTLKGDHNDRYNPEVEYCYLWSRASNYNEIRYNQDYAYYSKRLEIGSKNTTMMTFYASGRSYIEDFKNYNMTKIYIQCYGTPKELDFTNAVGDISAITDSGNYGNLTIKKLTLGSGVTSLARSWLYGLEELVIPKNTDFDLLFQSSQLLSGKTLLHIMKNIKDNSLTGVSRTLGINLIIYNYILQVRYVKEENGDLVWCNSTDPGATLATTYITNKGWTISN